jgi:uncharacterized LabA/DUF88 family protein
MEGAGERPPERAVVFVDGNNWFHCLREAGVNDRFRLDYAKISTKIIGAREWTGTKYYIGRVKQTQDAQSYADQRRFIDRLEKTDRRITVHFGRIEPRIEENRAARELRQYIHGLSMKIDSRVFQGLLEVTKRHEQVLVYVEKAVDVSLAVDMVTMGASDEYDAAYLLSADGDFTGAAEYVRSRGKKVFAACPGHGAELAKVVDKFIYLKTDWFTDCYAD